MVPPRGAALPAVAGPRRARAERGRRARPRRDMPSPSDGWGDLAGGERERSASGMQTFKSFKNDAGLSRASYPAMMIQSQAPQATRRDPGPGCRERASGPAEWLRASGSAAGRSGRGPRSGPEYRRLGLLRVRVGTRALALGLLMGRNLRVESLLPAQAHGAPACCFPLRRRLCPLQTRRPPPLRNFTRGGCGQQGWQVAGSPGSRGAKK
jgi:hypothetical protein